MLHSAHTRTEIEILKQDNKGKCASTENVFVVCMLNSEKCKRNILLRPQTVWLFTNFEDILFGYIYKYKVQMYSISFVIDRCFIFVLLQFSTIFQLANRPENGTNGNIQTA